MAGDRSVVLKARRQAPRAVWLAGACASYAAVSAAAWPMLAQGAYAAAGGQATDKPALSSLLTTGAVLAAFWIVALVAMALCWRRRGFMRVVVLAWPLVMLAVPDALRLAPTPWTWIACLVGGVFGAALMAGPERDLFGRL